MKWNEPSSLLVVSPLPPGSRITPFNHNYALGKSLDSYISIQAVLEQDVG